MASNDQYRPVKALHNCGPNAPLAHLNACTPSSADNTQHISGKVSKCQPATRTYRPTLTNVFGACSSLSPFALLDVPIDCALKKFPATMSTRATWARARSDETTITVALYFDGMRIDRSSVERELRQLGVKTSFERSRPKPQDEAAAIERAFETIGETSDTRTKAMLERLCGHGVAKDKDTPAPAAANTIADAVPAADLAAIDRTNEIVSEISKWQKAESYRCTLTNVFWRLVQPLLFALLDLPLESIVKAVLPFDGEHVGVWACVARSESEVASFFERLSKDDIFNELTHGGGEAVASLNEHESSLVRPAQRLAQARPAARERRHPFLLDRSHRRCARPNAQAGRRGSLGVLLGSSIGKVYSASSSVPVFNWEVLRQVLVDHVHGALVRVAAKADYASFRLILGAPARQSRIAALNRLERLKAKYRLLFSTGLRCHVGHFVKTGGRTQYYAALRGLRPCLDGRLVRLSRRSTACPKKLSTVLELSSRRTPRSRSIEAAAGPSSGGQQRSRARAARLGQTSPV